MRRTVLLLATCVLLFGRGVAADEETDSPAEVEATPAEAGCSSSLDASNFEASIRGKFAMVVFYAPWCGHCRALHPHFEKVCEDLKDEDDFLAAVVDAPAEEALAKSYDVNGFPTILWFDKREFSIGKGEDYDGTRSEAALLEFINKKTGWGVAPGGGLSSKAGRVRTMDNLVKEWVAHSRLPEHMIAEARKAVLTRSRAEAANIPGEGEKNDAKTYVTVFEKAQKDADYVKVEQARLRRLLHQGQAQMSKSKARVLGRRLNVLRVFDHFEEKLPGKTKAAQETHTIYTREQLKRFPPEELIEIVLEMQEKGCDTEEDVDVDVTGADFPHLWMADRDGNLPSTKGSTKVVDVSEDEPETVSFVK